MKKLTVNVFNSTVKMKFEQFYKLPVIIRKKERKKECLYSSTNSGLVFRNQQMFIHKTSLTKFTYIRLLTVVIHGISNTEQDT